DLDLKKTLAVLLDNILQRIGKLESKVENLVINGTGANSTNSTTTAIPSLGTAEKLNVADLINGAQEQCELPPMDGFPHCEGKIKWMKDMWKSDPCYASYGVDGSTCSFFIYLSEVENWCPRLLWRAKNPNEEMDQKTLAEIRTNFDLLYKMMSRHEEFRWMVLRIKRMADTWIEAIKSLAEKQNLEKRKRKKVLVHLGLLTKESGFKIAENAFSGGPLGELVQWSDLITSLYLLGHDIRISASWQNSRNSFGTEPEFNHAHYAQSKGHKTPWGKWNLNPQQFYTMFPHTPDNSFLGFVVEQYLNSSDIKHFNVIKRQDQSLVYGKVDNFWKDKKSYLDVIHAYTEVHGTVHGTSAVHMPSYVKNHGILSGRDLQFLLRGTKGPAPLEAIANGCAFLNPKFNPPKSSKNTDFFKGKPTLRELTSQHPYAEVYIGKPHVWTVNINDLSEVEQAVKAISSQKIEPYLPFEFTCEGMLQRMNVFIEKQDFCHGQVMWPPLSALQVKMAETGKSCKQVCQENQLICEPSFFQHLNKDKDLLKYNIQCHTAESANDILVPSFDEKRKHCVFQGDLLLFSCAGSHLNHKRICPCRDYLKGQVALCKDCL
ncbi:hypothetical protein E2320_020363, partial [Naja naja]